MMKFKLDTIVYNSYKPNSTLNIYAVYVIFNNKNYANYLYLLIVSENFMPYALV